MSGGNATHGVVKVRWPRGGCTSRLMPLAEAQAEADRIHDAVVACGEGWRFVEMTGWDDRGARIRGREVTSVEWVPDIPDRAAPHAAAGRDGATRPRAVASAEELARRPDDQGITLPPGGRPGDRHLGAASGTSWLQRQAGVTGTPEQFADQVVRA